MKVKSYWYDKENDQEWDVTATYNRPRYGTYWDPPEGGDFEDIELVRNEDGKPVETMDDGELVARFGEKALDELLDNLTDASGEQDDYGDEDQERYDYALEDDR